MKKSSFGKLGCALICSASLGLNATAQDQSSQQTGRTGQQAGQAGQQAGQAGQQVGQQAGQQAGQLQGAGQQQGAAMQSQNMIASCLVHDNQAEIALGRMAQEKAESGAVKKFAGTMVQDHQEFLTKLRRFAPNAGELSAQNSESSGQSGSEGGQRGQNRDGQDRGSQNQPGKNQAGQGQTGQGQTGQGQIGQGQSGQGQSGLGQVSQPQGSNLNAGQMGDPSMLALKMQREVAQQCLSDSQAKLTKQDGDKFDKCYMGMQIVAHAGMKSKLTVFSRHAQGELKQLIDQGLQTTEKHLDEAESIMKDLDKSSDSSETARRSNDKSDSTNK